jgi:predicted Co/Zn/Cd cation transporter (cation efflux family)
MIGTAIVILVWSMLLFIIGIAHILALFVDLMCFWGKVNFKKPERIEYKFTAGGWKVAAFVLGFAGTLWSVIVLAIKCA